MTKIVVPVSGGKDSQLCLALAVEAVGADKVLAVHHSTNFDHPLTYEHLDYLQSRYSVAMVKTQNTKYHDVPAVIIGEKVVPSSYARACTKHLKIKPFNLWLKTFSFRNTCEIWLGMRAQESQQRRQTYGELSSTDLYTMGDIAADTPKALRNVKVRLPIVELSTPAVYEALRARGDRINPLYARGHGRVGCYPCVLAGKKDFKLASRDETVRSHLGKVHEAIVFVQSNRASRGLDKYMRFEHDIPKLLDDAFKGDPFGLYDVDEDDSQGGCSWCSI